MGGSISQELTIIEIGGENRIDSRIVAKELGIEHESFMRTLSIYQVEFENLGIFRFQIGVKSGPQRGKLPQYVMLNEDQAIFAAALSRNTKQVVAFKLKLTRAFAEARKHNKQYYSLSANYEKRRALNASRYMPAYWNVIEALDQLSHRVRMDLFVMNERIRPDISVGQMFYKYLRSEIDCGVPIPPGFNIECVKEYPHIVDVRTGYEAPVKHYPNLMRGYFDEWWQFWYAPLHLERYLRGKMPDGTPRVANPADIPLIMSKLVYDRSVLR